MNGFSLNGPTSPFKHMRALVVDDDPGIASGLQASLRQAG